MSGNYDYRKTKRLFEQHLSVVIKILSTYPEWKLESLGIDKTFIELTMEEKERE